MNNTTEKAPIGQLLTRYGEFINASDLGETVALYTPHGVLLPNGAPLAKGLNQLTAAYKTLFKAFQLSVTYVADEVTIEGAYAYARTHSSGHTLIRATGQTRPIDNKELFVLHNIDGQWKIAQYMFNANSMT